MKSQDIFIAHPKTVEQTDALKAFMQAHKIKFEVFTADSYNPDFVKSVFESRLQATEGKVTRIKIENLKEYLEL